MRLRDAHNHLQHPRLAAHRAAVLQELERLGIASAVVNGTSEQDWEAVAVLARERPWIRAAYGVHPWFVAARSAGWLAAMRRHLEADARASVGEIGLDRWIEGHDLALQTELFVEQIKLAAEFGRPATVHCVRAWGALRDVVQEIEMPARGWLIHAYGGPPEMVRGFADHGAYFSFSTWFLRPDKIARAEVFRSMPEERLLVETDAPDLAPPPEHDQYALTDAHGAVNHPGNLVAAYAGLARVRGMPVEDVAGIVEKNFERLFG